MPVARASDWQIDTLEHELSNSYASKESEARTLRRSNELATSSSNDTNGARSQGYLEGRVLDVEEVSNGRQAMILSDNSSRHGESNAADMEFNADREALSSDFMSSQVGTRNPRSREQVSTLMTKLYTVSYLIFFSMLGTLARLGIQSLTFYPGAPVQTSVLWANLGGCLIMGFLSEDRKLFCDGWDLSSLSESEKRNDDTEDGPQDRHDQRPRSHHTSVVKKEHMVMKKTTPLYVGLVTGFCGSFTSFSSFIRDTFLALSNTLPVPVSHIELAPGPSVNVHRHPGYSFLATTAVVIVTISVSLSALQFGAHLGVAFEPYTPSLPSFLARKTVNRILVFVAWGCWLGAATLSILPPDRPNAPAGRSTWAQKTWRGDALFALVFAPFGCLLRFYASTRLNSKWPSFPLGTFAVNMFGTAMESVFFGLQHIPLGDQVACQVLQGAMDGFCGCLTTVSTWVAEMNGSRIKHAYLYGVASVGVGLGLAVAIIGSMQWTTGFKSPLCQH